MTTIQLQVKLKEKQSKIAAIVGEKEAVRLMNRALLMVKNGKKSILDIISE